MNNKLFEILNKQQGKIIQSKNRKIVVSAGPGSGKTYTIVKKIEQEFLCEEKNKNIIVTSFTKEGGADNFLDQKEQGEEKHGIYGTRKRTSSRPI